MSNYITIPLNTYRNLVYFADAMSQGDPAAQTYLQNLTNLDEMIQDVHRWQEPARAQQWEITAHAEGDDIFEMRVIGATAEVAWARFLRNHPGQANIHTTSWEFLHVRRL